MAGDLVYALVDIDSMYASVERVFRPDLRGKPVIVLSNNDGCAVARSAEAKALGVTMGQPWFQLERNPRYSAVVALSSNYPLYGDFSARLCSIAEQHTAWVEPYSIDECFLQLPASNAEEIAHQIRDRMAQWIGLPSCVGIGPTKTLAKLATRIAKQSGTGVHDLSPYSPAERLEILDATPVGEIWGIGSRLTARLATHDVTTAGQLARVDPGWIGRLYSVVVERTVRELGGTACIPLELAPPPRRQMMHCRMLGKPVTSRSEVADVASSYAQAAAAKLRRHHRAAASISVWLSSGGAFYSGPRVSVQASQSFLVPTNATGLLVQAAVQLAGQLWRPGNTYRRVGVMSLDLVPEHQIMGLWPEPPREEAIAATIDAVSARFGRGAIGLGKAGLRRPPPWAMRQRRLSPAWTTRWDQLATVH